MLHEGDVWAHSKRRETEAWVSLVIDNTASRALRSAGGAGAAPVPDGAVGAVVGVGEAGAHPAKDNAIARTRFANSTHR